ncbi:hypothetical protein SFRURICE_008600 [Spodoptera frugiperda]|nr:hypothetical protein SFRURICE_008600 [Spodoptera frugiperda]
MWLKPKICRKSLFHTNEVAGYNKSVEGSILFIENIEKINSRVLLGRYQTQICDYYFFVCLSIYVQASLTQNGEIKLPREDRPPRGRSRGQKLVLINLSLRRTAKISATMPDYGRFGVG